MSIWRTTRNGVVAMVATCALLGGCAASRVIDSDVQSFTTATGAVQPATYRFERLPSQASEAQQDRLETMAAAALAKVGLTQQSVAPRYAVQVSMQISTFRSPYPSHWPRSFWRLHDDRRFPGVGGFGLPLDPVWYRHAVRLLLRDTDTAQVVYETTASFDGPWADSVHLLPAVLDAALQGYPHPPSGPRKVLIELTPSEEVED